MRTAMSVLLWVLATITGVIGYGLLILVAVLQGWWTLLVVGVVVSPLGFAAWSVLSVRPCPRCAKGVKKGQVVCPTCGFEFVRALETPRARHPTRGDGLKSR